MVRIQPSGKISSSQISKQEELTRGTVVKQQIGFTILKNE
jgi:ribosomal protein S3